MKRKLFIFTVMTFLLVCMLLSVASAQVIINEKNVDENGEVVADFVGNYSIDNSTQAISSIDITYTTQNGETKEGKVYFATNLWGNYRQMYATYLPKDYDMNQFVYMPDKTDINGDGTFSYGEKITGTQGDRNLYLTYGSFTDGTFTDTVNVKPQLKRLSYSAYLEYFGPAAYNHIPLETVTYNGREAVEGTFFVSPRVNSFYGGTNASSFGGSANGNINGKTCYFTRLVFEERENSVSFAQYCFCRNVIEEVVFLKGKYGLRDDAIAYLWKEGTNTPCLKKVVVGDGAVFTSGSISLNVGTYDVAFIGTEEQYNSQKESGRFESALKNSNGTLTYEKMCYVYGHNRVDDYNCETADICTMCSLELIPAKEHAIIKSFTYENGYTNKGTYKESCTNEGCEHSISNETPAMFICLGYSADEKGKGGIVVGFKANRDAIYEYSSFTGKEITYGVFASSYENLGNNDIFDKNGNAAQGVIVAEMTRNVNYVFQLKIRGFSDGQMDKKIVMGAYVKTADENGSEYTYIQAGTKAENEKYSFVTYNQIVNPQD